MCMLHLEKACLEQEDLFYKWINDESVRKNSLHGHFVEYSEHCKWFEEKLQNKNSLLLICKRDEEYIGQVRIDFNSEVEGSISFSIDRQYRGQGFGHRILELLETYLMEEYFNGHKMIRLIARVKYENVPSQKCFEKLGYEKESEEEYLIYKKEI